MKRRHAAFAALCLIVLLNIVFTQLMINQYNFEKYWLTLLFAGGNVLLFPAAIWIYRRDQNKGGKRGREQ